MQVNLSLKPFEQAAAQLPDFMRQALSCLPEDYRARATEIRMRAGGAVALTLPEGPVCTDPSLRLSGEQLAQILRSLCGYSVHSYTEDIARGYVTLPGGHRAGLCGTAVLTGKTVSAVREISSVNLRIAREVPGAAAELCARIYAGGQLPNVLIAGAPGSGKTTLLRDLACRLSDGMHGPPRRVAVVDERGELAGSREGAPCCRVGANSDVLTGYPKGEGILLALRSLSPELVVCDELGGENDAAALESGLHAGVSFCATVHAGSVEDALARPVLRQLLSGGAFDWLVQLEGAKNPCRIQEIKLINTNKDINTNQDTNIERGNQVTVA